jgi:hypothetical protein
MSLKCYFLPSSVSPDLLKKGETQQQVQDFFKRENITRYWFGAGLNAGMKTPDSVRVNVSEGIRLREADKINFFHGVYTWTYESKDSIQDFLNQGVNGIMVNASECFGKINPWASNPIEIVSYVKSSGKKFASPADNPFCSLPNLPPCIPPPPTPPTSITVQ